MDKIYIFHVVKYFPTFFQFCKLWLKGGRNFKTYFHEMHFTSEVFADNGEPGKLKLFLEYFFFFEPT